MRILPRNYFPRCLTDVFADLHLLFPFNDFGLLNASDESVHSKQKREAKAGVDYILMPTRIKRTVILTVPLSTALSCAISSSLYSRTSIFEKSQK